MKLSIHGSWLWGAIVSILMTFGYSSIARADGPYINATQASLTYDRPYTSFKLYLTENNKKFSYWKGKAGYWTIKWDGKDLCTAANLKLNKGTSALMKLKKYGSWYAEYYNTELGIWVGAYNPQNGYTNGKQHDDECWVEILIVPSTQFYGQNHKVTVSGYWSSNDSKYKWYDLAYDVKADYENVDVGTLTRYDKDKAIFRTNIDLLEEWGCDTVYVDLLTSKGQTGRLYNTKLSASRTHYKSSATMSYPVDSTTICTYYPRQRYRVSSYVIRDKKPARPVQIIRDFDAQRVRLFAPVTFTRTDNYPLPVRMKQWNPATTSSGLPITYTSSNPDIATVKANGEVQGISTGKATITATVSTDEYYGTTSYVVKVVEDK